MATIKVSVVVPVFDAGRYLRRCAASLLAQTMSPDELELVFVDDGSTDDGPAYLDGLARAHPHVRVLHQANSGWPGRPRNVGLAVARGTYVFFCDADDWLAPTALADLWDFATACSSDVVLPKMAGIGRPVPHHVFVETVRSTTLVDGPLMQSLTAHKLFRRAFLEEHRIRFPEGRCRLEDHQLVVSAYLHAEVVSIYAERTCYTHVRREDEGNLTSAPADWDAYYRDLGRAVAIVEEHLPAGPARDRVLRRWLQNEIVGRASGRRLLALGPEEAQRLVAAASQLARTRFGSGVVDLLPPALRPTALALRLGDTTAVHRQAERVGAWRTGASLLQAGWSGSVLRLSGTVELTRRGADDESAPAEARFRELLGVDAGSTGPPPPLTGRLDLALTDPLTGEQWPVRSTLHATGLTGAFTADVDLRTVAAGAVLAEGTWELSAQYRVLGLGSRVQVRPVRERVAASRSVRGPAEPPAQVVLPHGCVALEVGPAVGRIARRTSQLQVALRWRRRRLARWVRGRRPSRGTVLRS